MAFADEIAKGVAEITPLVELALDGGTVYYGPEAVEFSSQLYSNRLVGIGTIRRALSSVWRNLQTTTFTVTLRNEDQALSAWDPQKIKHRILTVKLLANGEVESFFAGPVLNFAYTNAGDVQLEVGDQGERYFGQTNKWWAAMLLTAEDWPSLPVASVDRVAPIVLGDHDSRGAGFGGLLPTVQLNPTTYMVAGHAMKSVTRVFVGGEELVAGWYADTDYSWTGGINGLATIVFLDEDPGATVTCDGQGWTSDRTSDGYLLTDPVDQIEAIREYLLGIGDSLVDSDAMTAARTWTLAYHFRTCYRVAETKLGAEILSEIARGAFLSVGVSAAGKLALYYPSIPRVDGSGIAVTDREDILKGSLQIGPEQDAEANYVTVKFLEDWSSGNYLGQVVGEDTDAQTDLAWTYAREVGAVSVNEYAVAYTLKELILMLQARGVLRASWSEQIQHLSGLDLGSEVALTEEFGPADGDAGWDAAEFLIDQASFDFQEPGLAFGALDMRPTTQTNLGTGVEVGDDLPWTVL